MTTAQSETAALSRLLLKHPREAFGNQQAIAAQWRALHFTAEPDYGAALEQYDRFVGLLRHTGAKIDFLPASEGTGLDSIYVRDASIVCDGGAILCRMGKSSRAGEPAAQESALRALGIDIVGTIQAPGTVEGGDVAWLGPRTIAVGRGYRTNETRRCVLVTGNPVTRARLERAGAEVIEYHGSEISLKGGGGPTCLTRPLLRAAEA